MRRIVRSTKTHQPYQNDDNWLRILFMFINPFRGPGIIVAIIVTFVEEVGQILPWYTILFICVTNLLAIRLVSFIIMDTVCFLIDIWSWIGK